MKCYNPIFLLLLPLRKLRAWCLSSDQLPRFDGTSSNPCMSAVLLSHWITPEHDSYSQPTETETQTHSHIRGLSIAESINYVPSSKVTVCGILMAVRVCTQTHLLLHDFVVSSKARDVYAKASSGCEVEREICEKWRRHQEETLCVKEPQNQLRGLSLVIICFALSHCKNMLFSLYFSKCFASHLPLQLLNVSDLRAIAARIPEKNMSLLVHLQKLQNIQSNVGRNA